MSLKVRLFFRKPRPSYFSIEGLFRTIVSNFPEDIDADCYECPYLSGGLFKRLANLWAARGEQGSVNHITGDVHYLAMSLHPKRTILTVHDAAVLDRLTGWRRKIYKFFWFDWPFKRVALVTVISEATKAHLLENTNVSAAMVHVVPDCINEAFKRSDQEFNQIKPRILQIGTKKNKNILRVAEALRGIPCELRVIGKLTEEQTVALDSAGVEYTTASNLTDEALIEEYKNCDLVMFASLIEGFGMPILEAQTTGRVVITSNCSSMPEVAGEGACFVNPEDVTSIREGVLRVIKDDEYRQSVTDAGFVNVERFSAASVAEQYAQLYRKVAAAQ